MEFQDRHDVCHAWQQHVVQSRRVVNETSGEGLTRHGNNHRSHGGSSRTQGTSSRTDRRDITSRNVRAATPTWSGGAAVGFLSNTPDGTALALNLPADRFLHQNVSLGPLLKLGFTGDPTQIGFSGQGKYWIAIPETDNRAKVVLQAGSGSFTRIIFETIPRS